ncbi:MAG TPA: dipeptidase PepV [Bacillota bacterium]|nr:dipeptidase PepV [Bacillota bacterium]HOC06246.1 dipeptidase PepV [Bacillota bacterium]HPZ21825.1 dipeptidase PepV [Bacillota bacterium]HQD19419.1 dipeptidase PepV [Bacillota bacterium]
MIIGNKEELIRATQEIVRIASVKEAPAGEGKPFGQGVAQALEYALEKGRELGFKAENFSGYAGHIEYGEGNEIVGILCHLDVVPAGEGWSVDPFGGEIIDGKLYGRGTIDNKGPAMAVLYGLAALKESGWRPRRRIRLILGCDEESDWECMRNYLPLAGKPEVAFTPDAEFPVINSEKGILMVELSGELQTPKGIELVNIQGGNRPNMVPDRCRVTLRGIEDDGLLAKTAAKIGAKMDIIREESEITMVFKGVSAHGSLPETGVNAISYALAMLVHLGFDQGIINDLYEHIGFSHDGRGLNIEVRDEVSGPLTANMGVISMKGNRVAVMVDIRYPVSFTEEQILERLAAGLPPAVTLQSHGGKAPLYVDGNSELIQILQQVYEKHTGQEAKLISIGGGTYARALDNAVAFGPVFPGQTELAHQPDEYISVSHLVHLAEIYSDAIAKLGQGK